jgi:subtilisin-like proprotein convertase family protein
VQKSIDLHRKICIISRHISVALNKGRIILAALPVLLLCTAGVVSAQTTLTNTFSVNQTIPDGDPNGLANVQHLNFGSVPQFTDITGIQVNLNISGGFNGDYYGYLEHNGVGFAVLLNRVGVTSGNSVGYSDSGMNITFSDSAPDIHTYQLEVNPNGAALTGLWGPDGRTTDPSTVLDTDARTALLSSFIGEDPSGEWTLFLSDLDFGEQGQLVSWGLVITAVPEPTTLALALVCAGGFFGARRFFRRKN